MSKQDTEPVGSQPDRYSLDDNVDTVKDYLYEMFADRLEKNNDVLCLNTEFSRDVIMLFRLCAVLAGVYAEDYEDKERVRATMYRAMHFALDVVDGILPANTSIGPLNLRSLIDPLEDGKDWIGRLKKTVSDYFSRSPNVEQFTEQFMLEIDDEINLSQHVELAAGVIFVLSEDSITRSRQFNF